MDTHQGLYSYEEIAESQRGLVLKDMRLHQFVCLRIPPCEIWVHVNHEKVFLACLSYIECFEEGEMSLPVLQDVRVHRYGR